ncbi:hypothetical protein DH2020_018403 [Rehmannia glutinosa]|uniref:starch synthase n=1 Tax=Rehmannia glutinosa TaxID=99300 RepID=A0ABR0WKT1_REHGL
MILQSCSPQPTSTPANCFSDSFLVLHLKKNFKSCYFYNFKKRPKILKHEMHSLYCPKSLSSNFKIQALETDAGKLDDTTTKLEYDDLTWPSPTEMAPIAKVSSTQPDIIHVHEWQTGGLPLLYWDMYHYLSLKKPRIVLTIHNMEHYGECRAEQLSKCGLDGSIYATEEKAVDERTIGHNPERLSLLKGGIVYSNAVVTVSPTYLKETLCSGWLAGTLIRHRDKYFGILNGIDTAIWNPATDAFLPAKFDANNVEGKKICKLFVQRGLGLAPEGLPGDPDKVPLVVCITRLVAQKGLHLITNAIRYVEALCVSSPGNEHWANEILTENSQPPSTAPDARVGREFEGLAQLHNQGSSLRILLTYSEELSHMLYAAANIVLVPSIYEPCGLAQMIGMRYGAVPVVRKTGGLADTVFDMDDKSQPEMANGFVFEGIDEGSLNWALDQPNEWMGIVKKVMQMDNSWNNTAGKYIDIYSSVRARDQ